MRLRPDLVLVDLDDAGAAELNRPDQLRLPGNESHRLPSTEEPIMRVPPPHHGESYDSPFTRDLFSEAPQEVRRRVEPATP